MIVKGSIVRHGDSVTFSITDLGLNLRLRIEGYYPLCLVRMLVL
ncbi:hypothetical protein APHCR_1553 [Anaplasma phagocytophilum str. CR1007]|nr:hypothetical protein APHCR_1553 [Anaplasma phagocytophilum str. CR1007]